MSDKTPIELEIIRVINNTDSLSNTFWTNESVNLKKLLWAIAGSESSFGKNNVPRQEKSYMPGGKYFNKKLYEKFGDKSACSWGVWQMMLTTAYELGFTGKPEDLTYPVNQVKYVIRYLLMRAKGAKTVEDYADAYNTGNYRDSIHNKSYEATVKRYYSECDVF